MYSNDQMYSRIFQEVSVKGKIIVPLLTHKTGNKQKGISLLILFFYTYGDARKFLNLTIYYNYFHIKSVRYE
jgi:hypothetical protein